MCNDFSHRVSSDCGPYGKDLGNVRDLPTDLRNALVSLNNRHYAKLAENPPTDLPRLHSGFRFQTVSYPESTAPRRETGEEITHRIGAEWQDAISGDPTWKPIDRPCLGVPHHTTLDD